VLELPEVERAFTAEGAEEFTHIFRSPVIEASAKKEHVVRLPDDLEQ